MDGQSVINGNGSLVAPELARERMSRPVHWSPRGEVHRVMSDDVKSTDAPTETPEKPGKPAPKKPVPKPAAKEDGNGDQTAKPAAKKPAPAKKPPGKGAAPGRRFFLFTALGAAWTLFTVAVSAMTLGTVRFLFPNVLAEPPSQFTTGLAKDQFEPGQVNTTWVNQFQVWIVNLADEKKLIALSTICTHLGCTPSWLEQDQKFKCPCHGSGFYKNGINFEGPAPRPLERFAVREVDGFVLVDKSKKFQYELAQWDNPESFLRV